VTDLRSRFPSFLSLSLSPLVTRRCVRVLSLSYSLVSFPRERIPAEGRKVGGTARRRISFYLARREKHRREKIRGEEFRGITRAHTRQSVLPDAHATAAPANPVAFRTSCSSLRAAILSATESNSTTTVYPVASDRLFTREGRTCNTDRFVGVTRPRARERLSADPPSRTIEEAGRAISAPYLA